MRAQVAFEYMMIVAILLAFLAPIWIYMSGVQSQTSSQLALSYAKNAVQKVADAADLVYSQGSSAKLRVSVYIPSGVEGSTILNHTVRLRVRTGPDVSDVFATSKAVVNGSLPTTSGNYWVTVEAVGNQVQISV